MYKIAVVGDQASVMGFRALGLEAWGVAADGQNYRGQTMRDLREILARDKDVLWAIFWLGPPI